MEQISRLKPDNVYALLLQAAPSRPVFIWGAPGIGKSSIVKSFADAVGMECVTLLGSQLAPEDLLGVPKIIDGVTHFCPPAVLVKKEPFCLFLDELNLSSAEVLKAFYSLILDQRVGELVLPKGSVVIGAGNRQKDVSLVRTIPSALINRMLHVQMDVDAGSWIEWAKQNSVHEWVVGFIERFPQYLVAAPSKQEQPFSSPRSWVSLSDVMGGQTELPDWQLEAFAYGFLTLRHAQQFLAYVKQLRRSVDVYALVKGTIDWPEKPEDRDLLLFLAEQLLLLMSKELPAVKNDADAEIKKRAHRYKVLLTELAKIDSEILSNLIIARKNPEDELPDWFLLDISLALPRLLAAIHKNKAA